MFNFNKKKTTSKPAQANTGYSHGLAFISDTSKWVVPLNSEPDYQNGVIIVGSNADEIGSRVANTLATDADSTMMVDFKGTGLVSSVPVMNKATTIHDAMAMVRESAGKILDELTTNGLDKPTKVNTLLIINGIRPTETGDTGTTTEPAQNDVRSRLDANLDDIASSKEALKNMVGDDVADGVDLAINIARADTFPGVVTRWSIIDRLLRMSTIDDTENTDSTIVDTTTPNHESRNEDITLVTDSNGDVQSVTGVLDKSNQDYHDDAELALDVVDGLPENLNEIIQDLRMIEGESIHDWALRNTSDPVIAQAALALTQCDERIGLPWPMMSENDRGDAITILRNAVQGYRKTDIRPASPLEAFWNQVCDWANATSPMGSRLVIVTETPDIVNVTKVLPFMAARVIAGDIDTADEWIAGTVNEDSITQYGTGDMQIVSQAKIGKFHTRIGTLRSPRLPLIHTSITMV